MAKTFRLSKDEPLLNIGSYARGSPGVPHRLTPAQVEQIRRTVRRTPEAVVKVLPKGGTDLRAAAKHLEYIGRHGRLDLEGDAGERLPGRACKALLADWDLDIDDVRRRADLGAIPKRARPKIVHKIVFSMPAGTPAAKVQEAVRNFAREEFWGKHRYAMVLHTDEPHPHVHLVLKAIDERGVRLNIRKETLRNWRDKFACQLRSLGVPANATERAVRGVSKKSRTDAIFRAERRGASTHSRARAESIASDMARGTRKLETGGLQLRRTRKEVVDGWRAVELGMRRIGEHSTADQIAGFIREMPAPKTEREIIIDNLAALSRRKAERTRTA